MQTYISHSEAETESIGEKFAKDLPDGTVIAMYGDLGAGKTAFAVSYTHLTLPTNSRV